MRRFNVTITDRNVFEVEAPDEATLRALLEERAQYAHARWLEERWSPHPDEADSRVVWVDHFERIEEHELLDVTEEEGEAS